MAGNPEVGRKGILAIVGVRGFVGRALERAAAEQGYGVIGIARGPRSVTGNVRLTPDLAADPDLGELLREADIVVNLAARVHIMTPGSPDSEAAAYRRMNVEFPLRLAEAAAAAGIRRFVQLSSVAAVASSSPPGTLLNDASKPSPSTPYGVAKLEADRALAALEKPGFSIVSLRPPAIYGPGASAHFARLMAAARRGIPLPLGAIDNARSFAFVGNIADAILAAAARTVAGAYIVTDSTPLSTADLYRRILRLYGRRPATPAVPAFLVRPIASLVLRGRAASLIGDAAFDGGRFAEKFDWVPPFDLDGALRATVVGEDSQDRNLSRRPRDYVLTSVAADGTKRSET